MNVVAPAPTPTHTATSVFLLILQFPIAHKLANPGVHLTPTQSLPIQWAHFLPKNPTTATPSPCFSQAICLVQRPGHARPLVLAPPSTQPDFLCSPTSFCICGGLSGAFSWVLTTLFVSVPTCLPRLSALLLTCHSGHSSRPISTVITRIPSNGSNSKHLGSTCYEVGPMLNTGDMGSYGPYPPLAHWVWEQICKVLRENMACEFHERGVQGARKEETTSELGWKNDAM